MIDRRRFLARATAAGVSLALGPPTVTAGPAPCLPLYGTGSPIESGRAGAIGQQQPSRETAPRWPPATAPPAARRLFVSAHYYPWYGLPESADFRWAANDDYRPESGFYLSNQTAVIDDHVGEATAHGVDGFAVNWHGIDTFADVNTAVHLVAALRNHPGFRFAIFYDTSIRFGLDRGQPLPDFGRAETLALVQRDFDWLARTYFGDPAYQLIDGRPVVVMYITRAISRGLEAIVETARQAAYRHHGTGIFFIGDEIWWQQHDRLSHHAIACDAITAYSLAAPEQTRVPTSIRQFTARSVALYRSFAERIGARARVVPTLLFRHDDTLFRTPGTRIFPELTWTGEARYREDAAWVFDAFSEHVQAVDDAGTAPLFVTSWNEWPERTAIEPTLLMRDRYGLETPGRRYLEGLRDAREAFDTRQQTRAP